jgi:nucleotide-binding universal stress UspA family protein
MIDIKKILCPVDFSDCSGRAFEVALAMARWYSASVTALHVVAMWPAVEIVPSLGALTPPVTIKDADKDALHALLAKFVKKHQPGKVAVEKVLREALDIHREILVQATEGRADLILMGTHGRSGFERFLLGSATEKVLRKAACPVMTIPPAGGSEPVEAAPHFRRILCPIDFSESSIAALTFALSFAEEEDARITLLHVVEAPPDLADGAITGGVNVGEHRASAEAARRRHLEALVPDSARECCWVETAVVEGKASREILRVASARQSDLIVMGARGRGALNLLVFGSNTHDVIRAGVSPVLTVPASVAAN